MQLTMKFLLGKWFIYIQKPPLMLLHATMYSCGNFDCPFLERQLKKYYSAILEGIFLDLD